MNKIIFRIIMNCGCGVVLGSAILVTDASAATIVGRIGTFHLPPGTDACTLLLADPNPCAIYSRVQISIVKKTKSGESNIRQFFTTPTGRFRVRVDPGVYSVRRVTSKGLEAISGAENIKLKGNGVRFLWLTIS